MSDHSVKTTDKEHAHGGSGHGDSSHGGHEMHLKLYWGIGAALIALTGFTVALSYIDFGTKERNIVIAMLVAAFKVCLVGAIFMHLKGEKPLIWKFLYFSAIFVAGLFFLTLLAASDPIFGTNFNQH
jgi:caa(3)-type oxidase subunit IV